MDPTLIIIFVALTAATAVGGVGFVVLGPLIEAQSRASKRVRLVVQGARPKADKKSETVEQAAQRRKVVQDTLKDLEAQQKKKKKTLTLRQRLEQAGVEMTPRGFFIGSIIAGIIGGIGVFFSGAPIYVAFGAIFAIGFGFPRWVLSFLIKRRQKAFLEEFANALDVIVRGVKSGLPINECLKIIAKESPEPVGPEFAELVEGQKLGVPLDQGLFRMYDRVPLSEVNFFSIVVAIQQKTGGNLSEALGNLSSVLRARKMMRAKIQAMSSEAKASAAIIGSLPPGVLVMVYTTTPKYINLLFTDQLGNIMLVLSAMWMLSGVFVMKRMINFNF
jgi:tight adherence protein B